MTCLLGAKYVVNIENVVAVLIVVSVVLGRLAGFGEDPAGIPRRFILEAGIADSVGRREVYSQSLQGL